MSNAEGTTEAAPQESPREIAARAMGERAEEMFITAMVVGEDIANNIAVAASVRDLSDIERACLELFKAARELEAQGGQVYR